MHWKDINDFSKKYDWIWACSTETSCGLKIPITDLKKFSKKILDLVGPRKISFEDFVKLFSKNTKVKFKKINLKNAYDEGTYSSESLDLLIGDYTSDMTQLQKLASIKLTPVEKFLESSNFS